MEESSLKAKVKYMNDEFKKDIKFVDKEVARNSAPKVIEYLLTLAEREGIDQISILVRRISQTTIKANGKEETLYNMQYSCHVPGTIDDLIMYDAVLTTYYLKENGRIEQEVDFEIGSAEQAENLSKLHPDQIEEAISVALSNGDDDWARGVRHTYDAYFKIKEREENQEQYMGET